MRPFSVTLGALILFAVWVWIGMSTTHYRAGRVGGERTTAGWFVLGFPVFFGFGLLMSMPFSFVARRTHPLVGWLCLLAVFIPLIEVALAHTTPVARLGKALRIEPPIGTKIQRIEQFDSFNDGSTIAGVCSASPQFVDQVIATHALKLSDSSVRVLPAMSDEFIPENAEMFQGSDLIIYYDADRGLLYFYRESGRRRL